MGLGIWSMHFIAMLAFHMSIEVTYNVSIVIISVIPALISCGLAFYIISRKLINRTQLVMGAFFISLGIISMHYLGMEAMQMEATIKYDPFLWILSAIIAFVTSLVAVYLLFYLRDKSGFQWRKSCSAIVMGIAVSGMHYTGMTAAMFQPVHHHVSRTGTSFDSDLLAYCLGIGMLMILGMALITAFIDRKFKTRSDEFERKFHSVIESANDAIVLTDTRGIIIYWNKGAQYIFGFTEEVIGKDIRTIIPERFKQTLRKEMERLRSTEIPYIIGKTVELFGLRKDGREFPLEMSLATWQAEEALAL